MESYMKLKNFIVKTLEKIADSYQTGKINRNLFVVRNLLSKIPNGKGYLKILKDEFEQLKNTDKYKISNNNNSDTKPTDKDRDMEKYIEVFMKNEKDNIIVTNE